MTDIARARALFKETGLRFPVLPKKLALTLRERDKWLYSTRPIDISPYFLKFYVYEASTTAMDDYAVLSHSGHGVNSYAIQYYLIHGPLKLFLFLGWGGIYTDNQRATVKINECFDLADMLTKAAIDKLGSDSQLMVVASDFYISYWSPHKKSSMVNLEWNKTPRQVLVEVLDWLDGLR